MKRIKKLPWRQVDYSLLEQKDTNQEELIISSGVDQEDKEIQVPQSFFIA